VNVADHVDRTLGQRELRGQACDLGDSGIDIRYFASQWLQSRQFEIAKFSVIL
jgi:hypothetical protein